MMAMMRCLCFVVFLSLLLGCSAGGGQNKVPLVAFVDAFEDPTLASAREGFLAALADSGFSEKGGTMRWLYRNAQGDQPTLLQAVDYVLSQEPLLVATCPTLSTIAAVQRSRGVPVCMMVSPHPVAAGLAQEGQPWPATLFGVYETTHYLDTSLALIRELLPTAHKVGLVYNPSEPQSVLARSRLEATALKLGLELEFQPLTSSSEAVQVVEMLLSHHPDAFFALPDNTVFAAFETISSRCQKAKVPVFTSEAGLVQRGALCAFGADMRAWGYQAGQQAVALLRHKPQPKPEEVRLRVRMFNPTRAKELGLTFPEGFQAL
jgi:putative ABC transport system substrate-binding protein